MTNEHLTELDHLKKEIIQFKTSENDLRRKKTYDQMQQIFIETRNFREGKLNKKLSKIRDLQY
jgi:hypothetical protein